MNGVSLEVLLNDLRNRLSDYRFEHCMRVAKVSQDMALVYSVDEEKAFVAGLLHDIAKEFSDEENMSIIMKYNLGPEIGELSNKRIVHGIIGAYYLMDRYHLDDDIIRAVKFHTFGDVSMGLLEKIIFVADKIEPKKNYPGIEEERLLAYTDIDKAMVLCIENNIRKLESEHKVVNKRIKKVLISLKNKNM